MYAADVKFVQNEGSWYYQQASKFVGIEFAIAEDGNITISQKEYAERVLNRFQMYECNPRS